ncbi:MAG: hypothetical protein EOO08_00500 [Chitinophagaceae bacterium]|nr:MAG: hypothetical protein EOO08_00500 [Chitinophagaceae bacterium]
MSGNFTKYRPDGPALLLLALATGAALEAGLVSDSRWYALLYVTIPLIVILLVRRVLLDKARRRRRRHKQLLDHFTRQAERHGLRLSCQERLRDGMIGLDARSGKLFVCQRHQTLGFQARLLSLPTIAACSARNGQVLRLHFLRRRRPIDLVFPSPRVEGSATLPLAHSWAQLLRQLLPSRPAAASA